MKTQKGQALILIALAMVALVGLVALAIDGGNAFASRRQAQNASDAAALAAAYASVQGLSTSTAVTAAAQTNGYTHDGSRTIITTATAAVPADKCPGGVGGTDYTVTIQSTTDTWFGGIVGQNSVTNKVSATARKCNFHYDKFFWGNAVVGLNPGPNPSFDATGNAGWTVTGGGIFANGSVGWNNNSCSKSKIPNLTMVGGWDKGQACAPKTEQGGNSPVATNQTGSFVNYPDDILEKMPPNPCISGGVGKSDPHPTPSKNSTILYKDDVFCISNLSDKDGVNIVLDNATLYVTEKMIDIKFAGGGGFSGTPTKSGTYAGYYMIVHLYTDQTCTAKNGKPELVWTGNGLGNLQGTILAPSACVDVRGNSGAYTMQSQVIGHTILSMGTSDFTVNFNANEQAKQPIPPSIELLK